jgi:nitronate monooxygenase
VRPAWHDVPIVQSGMGGVAGPELAAAVCEAGGLGILAALMVPPDQLRQQIGDLRARTRRPFGVNIWLHEELLPPRQPGELEAGLVERVQGALNEIRRDRGLPPVSAPPMPTPDLIPDAIDVMVDERIPIFSAGVGLPSAEPVERFHRVGSSVMAMVTDVDDALAAVERGVDVVVAQGSEAGGHPSVGAKPPRERAAGTGTVVLVPAVRDALGSEVPLVAAGESPTYAAWRRR